MSLDFEEIEVLEIKDINNSMAVVSLGDNPKKIFDIIAPMLSVYIKGYQYMPMYKTGQWDGKKKFYKLQNNHIVFPKGLAEYVSRKLNKNNIKNVYIPIENKYYIPSYLEFSEFVTTLNLPFTPYDYQLKAAFESICNCRQVNTMATGAGKSLTIYIILMWMIKNNYKSALIVPGISLVEQMNSDFISYGIKNLYPESFQETIHLIGGEHKIKSFDSPITISTWQSLYKSPSLFAEIDCLIIDEVHKAKADVYDNIIMPAATGAFYKLGFTGTMPTELADKLSILGSIGTEKKYITPRQLIDMGLATPVEIKCLFLNYPHEEKVVLKRLKYQDEVKYITQHSKRNIMLAKLCNHIVLNENSKGNTIVLFDRVEHGENLASLCASMKYNKEITSDELTKSDNPYGIYLITGSSKANERENIRQLMETRHDVILFGTSSILSTGINIKTLRNLVLVAGGKAAIKLNQSIGRLLRLHVSKEIVTIWDIIDDFCIKSKSSVHKNYFYKHFEERLEVYNEHEYTLIEKEVDVR